MAAVDLNGAGRAVDVTADAGLILAGGGGVEGSVATQLGVDVQLFVDVNIDALACIEGGTIEQHQMNRSVDCDTVLVGHFAVNHPPTSVQFGLVGQTGITPVGKCLFGTVGVHIGNVLRLRHHRYCHYQHQERHKPNNVMKFIHKLIF